MRVMARRHFYNLAGDRILTGGEIYDLERDSNNDWFVTYDTGDRQQVGYTDEAGAFWSTYLFGYYFDTVNDHRA